MRSTRTRTAWIRRPGNALLAVTFGFLGWWVVGLSAAIFLLAAVLMGIELAHRRRILVPRGFGAWLLFLAWVVCGVIVLNVDAPGAVPGDSSSRYMTWAYRLAWYVAATVAMLYVGNLRRELSLLRVSRIMSWMFIATAVGGWLGVLVPHLEFTSLLEHVLPGGLLQSDFVTFLVHPQVVQLYAGAATDTARPSAPFPYSNIWGLNFACFLPFFVHAWMTRDAGWRRPVAPVVLALALVPAIQSLNRGLWVALIASAVVVVVRSVLAGRIKLLVVSVGGAALLAAVLAGTHFADLIIHRLDNPTSNDTRTSLGVATVESVVEGSPIVGFGTTRDVQGTFTSIAGGATTECPQCSPPALGTQGHLWLVVFSQGLVGAGLYLSFYLRALWRTRRILSSEVTVGVVAIGAHLTTMFVYDSIGMSMVAVGVGMAYLWREEVRAAPDAVEVTLGAYLGLVRRHWVVVTVCVALGLGAAYGVQSRQGRASGATVSLFVPADPPALVDRGLGTSMDTEGAYAHSAEVLAAMSAEVGHPVTTDEVFVSADPNSRILNLRFVGPGAPRTRSALNAAADVVISQRNARLEAAVATVRNELSSRAAARTAAYLAVDRVYTLVDVLRPAGSSIQQTALRQQRTAARAQITDIEMHLSRLDATEVSPAVVVTPPRPTRHRDGWIIGLTGGGMLGLLVGLGLAYYRDALGARARRSDELARRVQAPVLWSGDPRRQGSELSAAVRGYGAATFVAASPSPDARELARTLGRQSHSATGTVGPHGVPADHAGTATIIVVDGRTRIRVADTAAKRLRMGGHSVAGVLVDSRRPEGPLLDRIQAIGTGRSTRSER
ncbi:hypothetical protein GCM10023258_11630 [Terrabacter aeriphilus]|uniref:O-antigen ligase n=1 Tax=Terrabacter aeriphilus TaxID=515662 RepID=A0ABP9J8C3_9MICO